MSKNPKKIDRRSFVTYGLGVATVVFAGLTAYFATRPAGERVVEKTVEKPVERVVEKTVEKVAEKTVTVTAPAPGPTPGKPIKVLVMIPLTGGLASVGVELKRASEFAVELINKPHPEYEPLLFASTSGIPSLGGAKFEPVFGDTQSDPNVAKAELERLLTANPEVVAVVGAWQSAATFAMMPVAEKLGVPVITQSVVDTLTIQGWKYIFRISVSGGQMVDTMTRFFEAMDKERGIKIEKVSLLFDETAGSRPGFDGTKKWALETGRKIVSETLFPFGTKDFSAEVDQIVRTKPDLLVTFGYVEAMLLMMKEFKKRGVTAKIIHWWDIDPRAIKELGKDTDFYTQRVLYTPEFFTFKAVMKRVDDEFKQKYGIGLSQNSARFVAQWQLLAHAINTAVSTDRKAVREGLSRAELNESQILLMHGVKYDDKGNNILANHAIGQMKNGIPKLIWPFDKATTQPTVPFPPWEGRSY